MGCLRRLRCHFIWMAMDTNTQTLTFEEYGCFNPSQDDQSDIIALNQPWSSDNSLSIGQIQVGGMASKLFGPVLLGFAFLFHIERLTIYVLELIVDYRGREGPLYIKIAYTRTLSTVWVNSRNCAPSKCTNISTNVQQIEILAFQAPKRFHSTTLIRRLKNFRHIGKWR